MTLRITYGPWGETLAEVMQASKDAEEAGAEVVWFPEMHRSATVVAACAAEATSTIGVGTAIALAFARSPMITALEALDIDEIAGGRLRLGLGSGVRRLNEDWHNACWGKPVAHLRETVQIVRYFIANAAKGDSMIVEGAWEHLRIRGYQRPFWQARGEIPVYLAGMGPGMTRLAAEVGDGFISHELCSPRYLEERILPKIAQGLAAAGRQRSSLDVVVSACCAIDDDPAQARRWAAGLVGFYASVRTYADFFGFHGLAGEQARVIDRFRTGASSDNLAAVVPDQMVDSLTIAGTPGQVRDRLRAYDGLATTVKLTPPTHGLAPEETRQAQARILEMISDLASPVAL
ncbi:MAG TPA: LLM class flavin-dependent oxidoreductase [Streptosporangiaceae bacterium]|nr:LLM class flavin-dependent oxidoreductase [Streptosporangiaceae bacterium]